MNHVLTQHPSRSLVRGLRGLCSGQLAAVVSGPQGQVDLKALRNNVW